MTEFLEVLREFERELNPSNPKGSAFSFKILGWGEISTVFQIPELGPWAFKRMPPFPSEGEAQRYAQIVGEYQSLLEKVGVSVPEGEIFLFQRDDGQFAVYLAQKMLRPERFAHKLLHTAGEEEYRQLLETIGEKLDAIWDFNRRNGGTLSLALDGQLSNWHWERDGKLLYIDTSTPLFRKEGREQIDPELFLKSSPPGLRWVIRKFFLRQVLDRYYDKRSVIVDLAANLYKEGRPDRIPLTLEVLAPHLPDGAKEITEKELQKYYREDKFIWELFLRARKIHRFLVTKILRRRYEFLLPDEIKR